jgi:hypothetical protein
MQELNNMKCDREIQVMGWDLTRRNESSLNSHCHWVGVRMTNRVYPTWTNDTPSAVEVK